MSTPSYRYFKINTRSVGYKSIDSVIVTCRFETREVPNDVWVDFVGDTRLILDWSVFSMLREERNKLDAEMIAEGGTSHDVEDHIKSLIRELVLFGTPYSGYSIVTEVQNERTPVL